MLRDFRGYGAYPPAPDWPDGARLALNFVINIEEGSEPSLAQGDGFTESGLTEVPASPVPEGIRDLGAESMFEYGSRVGFWRLQRLFDEFEIPATAFACALALEKNPEIAQSIADSGWDVCAHGLRWIEHYRLSEDEERTQIADAVRRIEACSGVRPQGWYCRYAPSSNTRRLLVEHGGLKYDSDAYNDDLPYYVEVMGTQHLIVPYSLTYNDARFVLPQGYGSPSDFHDLLKRGFDYLWNEGETHPRMMNIGLHPRLIGQAGRISALAEFIDYAQNKGGVWFATRLQIANWWNDHHEEFER